MKISRKLIGFSLLACFVVSALIAMGLSGFGMLPYAGAETTNVDHYFYQQLGEKEKVFYEAMEDMAALDPSGSSIFIRGEDYDLVAHKRVTQEQLEAYANGDMSLLNAMGAARDAFYTDYEDIFYVDLGYLSLRVTQSADGEYHAYLGAGRAETYWTQGFNSEAEVKAAIAEYNTAFNKIVATVNAKQANSKQIKSFGSELAAQIAKVREAHRQVVKSTVYRLETDAGDDAGHVRTPYGVFVKGKSLCEGYARAFKAIMDKIGVPCVLINGVYRHGNNQEELHMWTYVKLDGSWYAVDPTFDDLNFDDREKWPADKHPAIANRTTPLDKDLLPEQFKEEVEEEDSVYADEMGLYYNEDYFLKGAAYMNTQHATSPYKSEVEYPFTYPDLAEHNIGYEVSLAHGGLFKVVQTPYDGAMDSTNVYVSVLIDGEWCGYAQAEAKGYYILVRYEGNYLPEKLQNHQDLSHIGDDEFLFERSVVNGKVKGDNIDTTTVWAYLNPFHADGSMYSSIQEGDGYTVLQDTSKPTGLEFALTTREPRPYDGSETDLDRIAEMTTFTGDLTMFEARSGLIPIKFGDPDYQPAPHIVRSTPAHTGKLLLSSFESERTYHITVEYDQVLKLIGNADTLQMSVYGVRATGEILKGTHAIKLSEVVDLDSVTYDLGEKLADGTYRCGSVSFIFTPYEAWAYDNVEYIFNFNLEGVNSHKQVNPATYAVGYECEALCYRAYGYHWNVFAQPRLMDEGDLSKEGWVTSDGTDVSQTKDRLALVVTKPGKTQNDEMMDMVKGDSNDDIDEAKSFTYNITLTICKSIVIDTGMGVRVCVGFPEGFEYEDSMNGVTFKAYHFTRDRWDNIIGYEEIECTVTPLGLVLMCKSFSPFAIVAVNTDPTEVKAEKEILITANDGGTAYSEIEKVVKDESGKTHTEIVKDKAFSIKETDKYELTVISKVGYVIETVNIKSTNYTKEGEGVSKTVNEKTIHGDADRLLIPLDYSELGDQNTIQVNFVPVAVKAAEETRGEAPVVQHEEESTVTKETVKKAVITVVNKSFNLDAGDRLEITATVTEAGNNASYQWFKDGVAVAGKTSVNCVIESTQVSDSGTYTLHVTTVSGANSVIAESEAVVVNVTAQAVTPENPGSQEPTNPGTQEPTNPGTQEPGKGGLSDGAKLGLIVGGTILGLLIFAVLFIAALRKATK